MCLFPSIINFMSNVNLFSQLKSRDTHAGQSSQKINLHQLPEPHQKEIASKKISNLEERVNKLNNIFDIQEVEINSSNLVNSSVSDYSMDDLKQKVCSLRTQLLDLGCVITEQMVKNMLGIKPSEATNHLNDESEGSELMTSIRILNDFLIFLENQADRLKKPRALSEKSAKTDIHPFFQKVSIDNASHPYIFTLNIRLAILNEKFSDLEANQTPYTGLKTASICLSRISHDIGPRAYKILEEVSKTHEKIDDAPQQIKSAKSKNLENAIAKFGF